MWMMGYTDGGEINTIQDPFSGRKLRPLMPRPATAASINPPCLTRIHGNDLLTLNHHLASMAEQNKRDLTTQQVVVSSRWNPTPEQLQTLEELYRRGTRTPSAEQIQHITAQLRRYGKIEGKNVFYWFQNHKARERQKRRCQPETLSDEQQPPQNNQTGNSEKREHGGANRTAFEVEQTKNWESPTNSSTIAEKSGQAEAECKAAEGWVQFDDDAELLQRGRNATWRTMNLSPSSSSPTNLIAPSSALTATPAILSPVCPMEIKPQHSINIFFGPYDSRDLDRPAHGGADEVAHTLQLFPLHSGSARECTGEEEEAAEMSTGGHVTQYQFLNSFL